MKQIKLDRVGADPEVFFIEKKIGVPRSVEGLIGGTKEFPIAIKGLDVGFFLQEDNVAAEYNIPPATTASEFSMNLQKGLKVLKSIADYNNCELALVSALHFTPDQLMTPHAQRLGCDPDFNAWTRDINPRPNAPRTLRTAAGHVHVSWASPDEEQRLMLAKTLDLYLAMPSLLIAEPTERRQLYGKAGCIRIKEYGIEYRVLGNEWLDKGPYRMHVFNNIEKAISLLNRNANQMAEVYEESGDEIQEVINTHDVDGALKYMDHFDIPPFPFVKDA